MIKSETKLRGLWRVCLLLLVAVVENGKSEEPAVNGECEDALPIAIGESLRSSTVGLETDDRIIDMVRCDKDGTFDVSTPGVWYRMKAAESRSLQLSTCSEDTTGNHRVTLFSLEEGYHCDDTACLASSKEPDPDCPNENATLLEWSALEGSTYYILVHDESSGAPGDFGLNLTDVSPIPDNNQCDGAIELISGETLQGTTVGATMVGGLQCPSGPQHPGVFYYVPALANETEMAITVCSPTVSFVLSVYIGDSCDVLECTNIEPELGLTCTDGMATRVKFAAEAEQDYYIYVHAEAEASDSEDSVSTRFAILMNTPDPDQGSAGPYTTIDSVVTMLALLMVALYLV